MPDDLVSGSVFLFFPVEFNLTKQTVRVVNEAWQWRYLGWLLYPFKDDEGNVNAPSVVVHAYDPGIVQDCMRIMQWACEDYAKRHGQ